MTCIQTGMEEWRTIRRVDFVAAPVCEAALVGIAGLAGWAVHAPLLFASLGPTAYEMIEMPERRSAQPYNVVVGHLIAVAAGMGAVWATGAGTAPAVGLGVVAPARVAAAVIASAVTVLVTLVLRATQPAALSTTLLIALGALRGWRGAAAIVVAVLLMEAVGEPARQWRVRQKRNSPVVGDQAG
ncbi:MAG TPA: HPP family protein [Acidobacteriaceae bacterium]|nr:HPP family protein [Acidobacteriaceae bacterium]